MKLRITHGGMVTVTGEFLARMLDLPRDATIIKVVHTHGADYSFDVLFTSGSRKCWNIAEGNTFPRIEKK